MFQGTAFPINTYETDSSLAEAVGMTRDWADEDRSKQFAVKNSAFPVRTILVQNSSGGALTPGMALKWAAGYYGTKVQAATNGVPICGFVPASIQTAATIPTGAYFWMIVHGPTSVLKSAADVAVAGNYAYVTCDRGLVIVNVADPVQPKVAATVGAPFLRGARSVTVTTAGAHFTWVPADFLRERGVTPWRHMPAWIPPVGPTAGFLKRSNARAVAKGLTFRPLAVTAKDTLEWHKTRPAEERKAMDEGAVAGIPAAKEAEVLAAWHAAQKGSA